MAKEVEEESRKAHPKLDIQAQDRITELLKANEQLRQEIAERDRALEALREREEKYRTLLETMEEGYSQVDLKGSLTFVNDGLCKILGLPKDKLIGVNNREYMGKETARKVYKLFNQVYNTGQPVNYLRPHTPPLTMSAASLGS